jgi:hypothetical protein
MRQAMEGRDQSGAGESISLTPSASTQPDSRGYGATARTSETEDDSHYQSSDGDETFDDDLYEEEDLPPSFLEKLCQGIKSVFLSVADVENLWDTPDFPASSQSRDVRRRNHLVVLFWFFILALSYAGERSTFKLLVDHAGPFRLMTVEMVTASHAIILGVIMLIAHLSGHARELTSLGVSLVDVGFMAMLDTISLLLVFLTGFRVSPTLTVILVQFTLPLTAFFTQFVHPDGLCSVNRPPPPCEEDEDAEERHDPSQNRRFLNAIEPNGPTGGFETYSEDEQNNHNLVRTEEPLPGYGGLSREHVWGSLIILLAVLLALCPTAYAIAVPSSFLYADPIPIRTAINTLLYASSCIPAAACMVRAFFGFPSTHPYALQPHTLNPSSSFIRSTFFFNTSSPSEWTTSIFSFQFSSSLLRQSCRRCCLVFKVWVLQESGRNYTHHLPIVKTIRMA